MVLRKINKDQWELINPIMHYAHDGRVFYIPKGFITDLATVPKKLLWLFPKRGADELAFVVHDYLYTVGGDNKDRLYADEEMYYIQEFYNASFLRRTIMFFGVRFFGGAYFNYK